MRPVTSRLPTPALAIIAAVGITAGLGLATRPAAATTVIVNHLGAHGWYSSDTRDASGTNLYGQDGTQPYLITLHGAVPGDDAKIAQQIGFVAGPAGSLHDAGAVRLYATDQNKGKANISVTSVTGNGFGAASALLDPDFQVSFRNYNQPAPTSRTLGLSISVTNGSDVYTFSFADPNNQENTWQTFTATAADGDWRLYGTGSLGAAPGGQVKHSLTDWANDTTFGNVLGSNFHIFEIGLNLGSYQRNSYNYLDWFQSNLVSDGATIDFQAASASVPEPGILPLFGAGLLGIAGLACCRRRQRAKA